MHAYVYFRVYIYANIYIYIYTRTHTHTCMHPGPQAYIFAFGHVRCIYVEQKCVWYRLRKQMIEQSVSCVCVLLCFIEPIVGNRGPGGLNRGHRIHAHHLNLTMSLVPPGPPSSICERTQPLTPLTTKGRPWWLRV